MIPVEVTALDGEQYSAYTYSAQQAPNHPPGTLLRLADGRWYRFAKNGGATLAVGNILQGPANVPLHVNQAASATVAGSRSPSVTLGATAAVQNQYAGGYLAIGKDPGGGELYAIRDHLAALASAALVLNLDAGHAIRTALTTASEYSLLANPYNGVIQSPITTPTGAAVGVAVKALTAGQWGWVQTKGLAMVLTSTAPVVGNRAVLTVAAAGTAGPAPSGTDATAVEIGRVQLLKGTGTYFGCLLALD